MNKLQNTIKWLDSLPNYKKTVSRLGRKNKKGEMSYCCLGVACNVLGLENVKYSKGVDNRLVDILPLYDELGGFNKYQISEGEDFKFIVSLNDNIYPKDRDFTNVRKWLINNFDVWVNEPELIPKLKKHYKKELAGMK